MKKQLFLLLSLFALVSCSNPQSSTSSVDSGSTSINNPTTPNATSISSPSLTIPSSINPSATTPIISTPVPSTPTTTPIPSTPDSEDYMTPSGRNNIFNEEEVGSTTAYAMGRIVLIEEYQYSTNCNVYVQDGDFTYQIINVKKTIYDYLEEKEEALQIGEAYMFTGIKRLSPDYGFRIDCDSEEGYIIDSLDEDYNIGPMNIKSFSSINEVTQFPTVVGLTSSVLKNKDNVSLEGNYDKPSFVIENDSKDIITEIQKGLDNGKEVSEYVYDLSIGDEIDFAKVIIFSPTLARITSMDCFLLSPDYIQNIINSIVIPSEVTGDILLPTSKSGAIITWTSNNEKYISSLGKVTRPAYGEEDVVVSLTASFSFQGVTTSKSYNVKVLAETTINNYTEPYIRVYMEGSGSNKVIGIANPSSSTLNLSDYSISMFNNGASTSTGDYTLSLSGNSIESNDTFYLVNNNASLLASFKDYNYVSSKSQALNFNGDDAIALYKNGILIDLIGVIGSDPGDSWTLSGLVTTKDHTLVRSSSIKEGNKIFTPSEWLGYDKDSLIYLS